MRKILRTLILLSFILGVQTNAYTLEPNGDDTAAIDQELVKEVDVTGDGIPDKIVLHLVAKNMRAPFLWTLTIISQGKQIFSYRSDDAWLDKFFSDKGYVRGCKDYMSCKKKYYYHDIMDSLVLTSSKWHDIEGILDKSQPNTLYPVGRKQLRECCSITGQEADAILTKIENKFRTGKAIAINVHESPVHVRPPLIFVPEVGRFVGFYEE